MNRGGFFCARGCLRVAAIVSVYFFAKKRYIRRMNPFFKKVISAAFVAFAFFPLSAQELGPDGSLEDALAEMADAGEPSVDDGMQREFRIVMSSQRFNLNPHAATYSSEAQVLDALYEGLYSYQPKTLEPVPALATECKVSRDKKRLTFTIRENARFSDGSPINAFSVRNSWLMLLSTPDAPYSSLLDCVRGAKEFRNGRATERDVGITARDDRTLVVNLVSPTAHFTRIICHHAFSVKTSADNVFSGAFVIKERTDNSILLEKNHNYWDAVNVHLPAIRITTSDELRENSFAFNVGDADWISSTFDAGVILNKNAIRLSAIFGTEYLFFSCRNEPWNRADFRNALIQAVPWAELRRSSLVQATTLVYPLSGYPQVEGLTDTSAEDAADMMREARKSAGIPENEKLKISFGISALSERQKKFAELLSEAWKPLGVDVDVQVASDYRYIESIPGWNADIFVYSWIGDFADPLAFLELFREGSTLNQTKWSNERYTQLLDEASRENGSFEHYKLLAAAEGVLLDDGVVMPVSHSISLHALNPARVGGWFVNALDIHPYKYLFLKESRDDIPNVVKTEKSAGDSV